MTWIDILAKSEKFAIDNSPVILTVIGVAGTVSTAVLTGKASFKAAHLITDEEEISSIGSLDLRERLLLVWPLYVPPVATGGLTITAIIMSHKISTGRTAALAAAYTISEKAFEEYRVKVIEKLGEKKEQVVQAEVAQDKVNQNPIGKREVIVSSGEVLCYDEFTGRYFNSTVERIRAAQNNVNSKVLNDNYCSLSEFYSMVGLATTSMSEEVGWNVDRLMEIRFSTVLSDDNRPCISIDFNKQPIRDYYKLV
jgi:hypothetical protein